MEGNFFKMVVKKSFQNGRKKKWKYYKNKKRIFKKMMSKLISKID